MMMLTNEDYDNSCTVGVWSKSLEEQLASIEETLEALDADVTSLFSDYLETSVALKQATTILEEQYKKHFQEIKRDYTLRSQD
ncbi:hypothetical protein L596_004862 [Steinernema carpocapsae]|uniref:Uncharacterized protein n=1 Tax=Steinernema carpocapsae TaxID=34508 RepID=A0A4U8UXD4_STECR|nr:hypothetical protein L596_004862 [Steinernema carpocapsae]